MEIFVEKYIKYAPIALFCLTIGKLIILPASWESAATALVVGLVAAAYELKSQDKKVLAMEARFDAKVKELEAKNVVLIDTLNNHAKAFDEVKTHISGLNLARNLKQSTSTPMQKIF